jgi:hypothetical protein
VLLFYSCEEEETEPRDEGEVTLSSRILGSQTYYVMGFSFERDEKIPTTGSNGFMPDIVAEDIEVRDPVSGEWNTAGIVLRPATTNPNSFVLNFSSSNAETAQEWFDNYREVEFNDPFWRTDTLRPEPVYQVYTYRTIKDNYVKLLIRDVTLIGSDYGEVVLQYRIQRDGSTSFSE